MSFLEENQQIALKLRLDSIPRAKRARGNSGKKKTPF